MRTYSAVPTQTEAEVPMPAPTTPSAGTRKGANPKIKRRLREMFTACMTSRVFM